MPKHRQPIHFEPPPHASAAPLPLPFLPTKLHRPPSPPHAVPRPQLLAQLHQGLARGHKLTLVVAPAGFGKTTLVSQWLDALRPPRAPAPDELPQAAPTTALDQRPAPSQTLNAGWLALDAADNELARFLQYLVAAVQTVFPTTGTDSLRLLQAPQLPPVPYLATTLLSEWAALPAPCLLVLEDYHFIGETTIHQLLAQVLDHLPSQVHLVLLSRTEPPLPLARLRVQQQMTELRTADLSFSYAETQAFLAQTLGYTPPPETITALHTQTEGWVAGLQLATLARSGLALAGSARLTPPTPGARTTEPTAVRTFGGTHQHVMAYLLEEVLARQLQTVQTFLLYTAILERFCAPLGEALSRRGGGEQEDHAAGHLLAPPLAQAAVQSILAYLVQANLFIVPLDDQGEWYRYHHLFRELLRQHLHARASGGELATLHRRASAWLADHGWLEEAIQHALAAGDDLGAAQLVERRRQELLNREDWRSLERWLALLPEALVQQRPALLIAQAILFMLQYKSAAAPALLQAAEARAVSEAPDESSLAVLRGEIAALWSQLYAGPEQSERRLHYAEQALAALPPSHLYLRSVALLTLGLNLHLTGQTALAVRTLQAALEAQLGHPNTLTTRTLFALAHIDYLRGDFSRLAETTQALRHMALQTHLGLSLGWSHYLLGVVHYEWNELEHAAEHFATLVEQRYSAHRLAVYFGWLGLAWTYQAQGRFDQARQQVAETVRFLHEMSDLAFLPAIHSFQARLALQQGEHAIALRWVETTNLDPPVVPLTFFELPHLTRAKILLNHGTAARIAEANRTLVEIRAVAETSHSPMRLIEILALQALTEAAQGHTEAALATLQQAVVLAQPGRFLRTFVDLGTPLAALLYQLAAGGVETTYLGQVLAAFPPRPGADDLAQRLRQASQVQLIEPLTERESEVLLHLQQGLSNKAIAHTLNIAALTVKRHLTNLYQKLGVKSRKQAVARARALGMLPPAHE